MAKKKSTNDKIKRDAARQKDDEQYRYPFRRTRTVVLLALATAVCLTLAFPPANVSMLALVGLVPLLVAIVRAKTTRAAVLAALLSGLVFFGINCYWLFLVTWIGAIALLPYLAAYFGVFAWGVRRIGRSTRWPMTIIVPVLWVSLEYLRSVLLTGFPWLYLGHALYADSAVIQMADVTGAYGISFFAAMTSGLIADALTRPLFLRYDGHVKFSRALLAMTALVAVAWLGALGYGLYRLGQDTIVPGPRVATIQGNIPQAVKRSALHKDIEDVELFILEQHVSLTEKVIDSGEKVDMIIWPETMVPGEINEEFLSADIERLVRDPICIPSLLRSQLRYRGYWLKIRQLARKAGANMLVGTRSLEFTGARVIPIDDNSAIIVPEGKKYNSAILIRPETPDFVTERRYDKSHLVLFGEYVPLRSWPALYNFLQSMTPYAYDYSLTPGKEQQEAFEQNGVRYSVPICYEGAIPGRIRQLTMRDGKKRVDFLVNISNDAWFVNPGWFPKWVPATELDQHLNLYVFRAIENRVGIVRSVNAGISAFITPNGKIEKIVRQADGRRHNIRGYLIGKVYLDSRVTFYSRYGDVFAGLCLSGAVLLATFTITSSVMGRRERQT
ncbi:MAG: apolipoprotein N-acyltransferase [Planctomycetia bacterium]|nr:apolipoprotein N-acyltransferase [Planctomycetia bacterium]